MGLIALIDNRPVDKELKKQNEIICVKLDHSPWSDIEKKYFLRIAIEDAELESKLKAKYKAGEPHPIAVYPYAVFENGEMTNRSLYKFQRNLMSSDTLSLLGTNTNAINDRTTETPVLTKKKEKEEGKPFNLNDMTVEALDDNPIGEISR